MIQLGSAYTLYGKFRKITEIMTRAERTFYTKVSAENNADSFIEIWYKIKEVVWQVNSNMKGRY